MWIKTYWNRLRRKSAYWGKLGQDVVQCQKKVMVFDYPNIILQAETVEEATDFFTRERINRKLEFAGIYQHERNVWKEVHIPSPQTMQPQSSDPSASAA
ncbi:MAG TPA: hypothetical protein VMS21_03890 [Methylomirabilota bacterium]|nr:hypothetical protein [Methylomirabilota bacterium]